MPVIRHSAGKEISFACHCLDFPLGLAGDHLDPSFCEVPIP
jgi:hypothetical protein